MLSESSYLMGLWTYVGSAFLVLFCLGGWLRRSWRPSWVALVVLLAAALLLTPAYPRDGVETMAPALVVAGFQFLTHGYEAALHALRPLAFMCALAVGTAALLRVTVFRSSAAKAKSKKVAASA